MAGTFWFSEALGSAEPEAFLKRRGFLCHKKPHKKSQEIWENVVRNAKNRPWNATRQLFSGCFRGIFREFQGAFRVFSLCPFRVCPVDPSKHRKPNRSENSNLEHPNFLKLRSLDSQFPFFLSDNCTWEQ